MLLKRSSRISQSTKDCAWPKEELTILKLTRLTFAEGSTGAHSLKKALPEQSFVTNKRLRWIPITHWRMPGSLPITTGSAYSASCHLQNALPQLTKLHPLRSRL